MEFFSLGLSSTVSIRSQSILNIFPASFFNDRSSEKKVVRFYEDKHFLYFGYQAGRCTIKACDALRRAEWLVMVAYGLVPWVF